MPRILVKPQSSWVSAIVLLSLDVTMELLPLIGLKIQNPSGMRNQLRSHIQFTRRVYRDKTLAASVDATNGIELSLDTDIEVPIVNWMEFLYCEEATDHPGLLSWEFFLRSCMHSRSQWEAIEMPTNVRAEAYRRLQELISDNDYKNKWLEIVRRPLSTWDLHMHVNFFWDDEVPGYTNAPELQLYPTYNATKWLRFWTWINSELAQRGTVELTDSANRIRAATPAFNYISELVDVSTLRLPDALRN